MDGRDRLLPFVDAEIAGRLQSKLERLGLRFIWNTRVNQVTPGAQGVQISLSSGEMLRPEMALFAAGRQSNIESLCLETLGMRIGNRGLILVNEHYQTSIPNIYAAGDVIGFPALSSTSMEQARLAVGHAFQLQNTESFSQIIPLAVYTIPEISMFGLSESDCQQKNIPYLVGRASYSSNPRGQIIGDTDGMIKLIFAPENKKLLGGHIIGEMASELIHMGVHVMASGGTIDAFIHAVYNYPTLSDSYKYAAYDGLGQWEKRQGGEQIGVTFP